MMKKHTLPLRDTNRNDPVKDVIYHPGSLVRKCPKAEYVRNGLILVIINDIGAWTWRVNSLDHTLCGP